MLNLQKGFVGYVADTVEDVKKETKNKSKIKKILKMILIKSLKFSKHKFLYYRNKKNLV